MPSPGPKESWQRPLPLVAGSSAPEARVEADAEYFFTFERSLDGFNPPHLPQMV